MDRKKRRVLVYFKWMPFITTQIDHQGLLNHGSLSWEHFCGLTFSKNRRLLLDTTLPVCLLQGKRKVKMVDLSNFICINYVLFIFRILPLSLIIFIISWIVLLYQYKCYDFVYGNLKCQWLDKVLSWGKDFGTRKRYWYEDMETRPRGVFL